MASPFPFTSGQVLTAAELNEIGDIQTYTPTWTASGGTPTIGNGTLTGKYTVINNWCVGSIRLVLGSTSSIAGTTEWRWSLPVSAANTSTFDTLGAAFVSDAGTLSYRAVAIYVATDKIGVYASESALSVSAVTPFTFTPANADKVTISFAYEVA